MSTSEPLPPPGDDIAQYPFMTEILKAGQTNGTLIIEGMKGVVERLRTLIGKERDLTLSSPAILLHGLPAPEKLLILAHAVADEYSATIIHLNLGDVDADAEHVRACFDDARNRSPSLVIINLTNVQGKNQQALQQLFNELGRIEKWARVRVVGIMDEKQPDPSWLRSERFSVRIEVPALDPRAWEEEILYFYLSNHMECTRDASFQLLAEALWDATEADLRLLVQKASGIAVQKGSRSVTTNDLDEAIKEIGTRFEVEQKTEYFVELGRTMEQQGQNDEAITFYERALSLFGEGLDQNTASLLARIGRIHQQKGYFFEALNHFHQALAISEKIGDIQGTAGQLNCIGFLHEEQDRNDEAVTYFRRAQVLFEQIGDELSASHVQEAMDKIFKDAQSD